MEGFNVLYPMGWDAFGLPTENYALKKGVHPKEATEKNIATFKRQIKSLGLSFDWDREINTTDPNYYRWTQWIFLKLYKKGLAYQAKIPINWCPSCRIGLANEEVIGGKCERCGGSTERREVKQWMLRITAYAERLLNDLEVVDYSPRIKAQQINWIGRSEGATVFFPLEESSEKVAVFTTRPDTLLGVTALVLAPEHSLVESLISKEQKEEVYRYINQSKKKSDFERTEVSKEKTGIFTGSYCLNPISKERLPVWVADYVVATYGGGAVMVVPAHDQRDYDFAKRYHLEVREVIAGGDISQGAYTGDGQLINSGSFNGLPSTEARAAIVSCLKEAGLGEPSVNYKLRDWVFSRQHYWGEPIPIVHCPKCGEVPVPEDQLPVELPFVEKYEPSRTGESPLSTMRDWVETTCPVCGGSAQRETDTMPNWAGSSWYFLRYLDPHNQSEIADKRKLDYWMPVDLYNGGMEHTTLHLLYSRFWHKFLFDLGLVSFSEPYAKRRSHGVVLAADGRKMSKSFGNVINPDEIVRSFGADTLRIYEMFMGPFEQMIRWDPRGVEGAARFLGRVWRLLLGEESHLAETSSSRVQKATHLLIKKVSEDLEAMRFNTVVAAMMEFTNLIAEEGSQLGREEAEIWLRLLAPLAPHLAEELYQQIAPSAYQKDSSFTIHHLPWPNFDPQIIKQDEVLMVVQVNGHLRSRVEMEVSLAMDKEKTQSLTESLPNVQKFLSGRPVQQVFFVPGKLINFVV